MATSGCRPFRRLQMQIVQEQPHKLQPPYDSHALYNHTNANHVYYSPITVVRLRRTLPRVLINDDFPVTRRRVAAAHGHHAKRKNKYIVEERADRTHEE
jgi:hypothetical protein